MQENLFSQNKVIEKRARIGGNGKAVHRLQEYDSNVGWGVSVCGCWAGLARLTKELTTCRECRKRL